MAIPVIAVFDVGKTNKKVFFFDEQYKIVLERSARFEETVDEDGDPCEDITLLSSWVKERLRELAALKEFDLKAVNFSAYGASFVHVDENGDPVTPLYNYLKPYPEELKKQFYDQYGGELKMSTETASPVLGSLNSGMQLYRLKHEKTELFKKIKYSLHLPQYLSFLITGKPYSDITSIGCHTGLWDFTKKDYHRWVKEEGVIEKLAPLYPSDAALEVRAEGKKYFTGVGLHDSSAAFIPFITSFQKTFVLLSTGTWCVSLNAFNSSPLTEEELKNDCLCYISFRENFVKASRLFAGNEHEQQSKRIASHFNVASGFYNRMLYNSEIATRLKAESDIIEPARHSGDLITSGFENRDLSLYASKEEAYHQLIIDLLKMQTKSTKLVLNGTSVRRIFVDGGFSKNPVYMNLLAGAFPDMEVFAASVAQATSIGAALALHNHWNSNPLPSSIIDLKYYSASELTI